MSHPVLSILQKLFCLILFHLYKTPHDSGIIMSPFFTGEVNEGILLKVTCLLIG
jgi:hypothetical protein